MEESSELSSEEQTYRVVFFIWTWGFFACFFIVGIICIVYSHNTAKFRVLCPVNMVEKPHSTCESSYSNVCILLTNSALLFLSCICNKLKKACVSNKFSENCADCKRSERLYCYIGMSIYLFLLIYFIVLLSIELSSNCINELDENEQIPDLDRTVCYTTYILQKLFSYFRIIIFSIMCAFEILLFFNLTSYLKNQLYFYYTQVKVNRIITMMCNVMFLTFVVVLDIVKQAANLTFEALCNIETYTGNHTYLIRYLYLSSIVIIFISFFVYVFCNIKNIRFKIYMHNILYGYRMSSRFESISMFIIDSPWKKEMQVSFVSSGSQFDKTSFIETTQDIKENYENWETLYYFSSKESNQNFLKHIGSQSRAA